MTGGRSEDAAAAEAVDILGLAIRLARAAGTIQRERFETELEIGSKRNAEDLVTDVDRACEAVIVDGLDRARPRDAILAEEGTHREPPGAAWRWVIDPLDGTINYAHGYPCFGVSIAVESGQSTQIGVVYNPILDELYHAVRGAGAFRNETPIHVSREGDLARSLIATGFPYDRRQRPGEVLATVTRFLGAARGLRRDGSAALDLCAVACGRFDGYWELELKPWDVAAGNLIVEEAGGHCSDRRGERTNLRGGEVVASNGHIHAAMLELLAG